MPASSIGSGSFARLIRFDKRGTGLSDRAVGLPDFETRMDDVRAVMDAAESQRAALFGYSEGGPMSVLFAASYPQRTRALVLYGSYAKTAPERGLPLGSGLGGACRARAGGPHHPEGHTSRDQLSSS
jgi:pimeloyl-ACP methyl ester carboxylesterase